MRVLVVDNDKAHAHSMLESLQRVGYPCEVAVTGPEGVERIEAETFEAFNVAERIDATKAIRRRRIEKIIVAE